MTRFRWAGTIEALPHRVKVRMRVMAELKQRSLIIDATVYLLVRAILCLVQALSVDQLESLARFAGWLFGDVLRVRHQVVIDNLSHALPGFSTNERNRVRQGMWRHLFLLLFEMALAHRKLHRTTWRQHVRLSGARELVSYLLTSRAVVAVTGHFGNFEITGYVAGLFGFPSYTIARRLDNPYLDRFLRRFREATGQSIVDASGTAELAQTVLETGATLAILGDHHAGRKGCWVEFLGRPASCHKSVALFSLTNNVPLLVVVTTRQRALLQFELKLVADYDPLRDGPALRDVQELTQWYNQHLERQILAEPAQYWWLHRRWKDKEEKARKVGPARQLSLTAR